VLVFIWEPLDVGDDLLEFSYREMGEGGGKFFDLECRIVTTLNKLTPSRMTGVNRVAIELELLLRFIDAEYFEDALIIKHNGLASAARLDASLPLQSLAGIRTDS
jgi:hypothetical protein